jgi:hypothetical protein
MEAAKAKFTKLRSVCIGAEQGLRSLLERLMVALEEVRINGSCHSILTVIVDEATLNSLL